MDEIIQGLHHITAIASDPQKNLDFYAGILGLRFVKKTINFDAPDVYHLYYGDEKGSPGTIITFFPFLDIPKGRKGKGQLTAISFSIDEKALDYWLKRLTRFQISYQGPYNRFEETVVSFEDYDGVGLELVATDRDSRQGFGKGNIPLPFAIKGFYGITLNEECYEKTAALLIGEMDHALIEEKENRHRFTTTGKPGSFVDILCSPDSLRGVPGYGTVHHVAFATPNDETQLKAREKLIQIGLNVTPVINREYFHSIYFREPGGVLFEVATLPPGFTIDEPLDHLGESLKLPPWEEKRRSLIEKVLPPIQFDSSRFKMMI